MQMHILHNVRPLITLLQARNQGGSVGSYEPPPPRDHVGRLGPFFLYVFRKLDCHNILYCL